MPQRNSRKTYIEKGYYHVYNRGVEKRTIFDSDQDYKVFLGYLRQYLTPPSLDNSPNLSQSDQKAYQTKCYADVIQLGAYVLMPNHFHLLIKQENISAMKEFLQSLSTRYSVYFNKRYNRVGSLFQGRYKAVTIKTDEQLVHLSRYIHLNPTDLGVPITSLSSFKYSSYPSYLGESVRPWLNEKMILSFFQDSRQRNSVKSYVKFVEDYAEEQLEPIKHLILD
ncbi:MAG: transposase [Candidatus Berkelbacteria bacterium]|nr:transposase [Candidatus Berkelbacteria bacterium]MCR4307430.1 transposase [Candidatus Berkelbacteria bacterium]